MANEKNCISMRRSKLMLRTPPMSSRRCTRLNGYCAMALAPRETWVSRNDCSKATGCPSTEVTPLANAPVT